MLNNRHFPSIFALILLFLSTCLRADGQALLQMVDNIGVDYPQAVEGGQVINEFKYAQVQELAVRIAGELDLLEASAVLEDLKGISSELGDAIVSKAPAFMISEQTQAIRRLLMSSYMTELMPQAKPDIEQAAQQ